MGFTHRTDLVALCRGATGIPEMLFGSAGPPPPPLWSLAFHRRFGTSYCYNRRGGEEKDPAHHHSRASFCCLRFRPFYAYYSVGRTYFAAPFYRGAKELKGERGDDAIDMLITGIAYGRTKG